MALDILKWLPTYPVSAENDNELQNYFLQTEDIDQLISSRTWLLIGRKGTGKTAIYVYLKNSDKKNINGYETAPLSFDNYPWPVHSLYRQSMEGDVNAFNNSWRYVIVTTALAKLIQIRNAETKKLQGDLKKCSDIFQNIYGSPTPTLVELIKSKLARVKKIAPGADIASLGFSPEISFEEISRSEEMQDLLRYNAFSMLRYFEHVLQNEIKNTKIMILMDSLDENWLKEQASEFSKILISLITVCKNINIEYSDKLKVLVFLRTDIFEHLVFNDKNKIKEDAAAEIKWDDDKLDKMYFSRIKKQAPKSLTLKTESTNSVFREDAVIHGATPFRHILRRSFYRPRDIITFMNKVRSSHVENESGLYTKDELYKAERDYSDTLYREFLDEWSVQYPDLNYHFSTLKDIGTQQFSYADFKKEYASYKAKPTDSEIQEILKFLFVNSVIGQKQSINWTYYCVNEHLQINYKKKFKVNNGLKYALSLTETREKKKKN